MVLRTPGIVLLVKLHIDSTRSGLDFGDEIDAFNDGSEPKEDERFREALVIKYN